jgi:hypothetical protein
VTLIEHIKSGGKVQTRSGRSVEIYVTDVKGPWPIVGKLAPGIPQEIAYDGWPKMANTVERAGEWTAEGRHVSANGWRPDFQHPLDLLPTPMPESPRLCTICGKPKGHGPGHCPGSSIPTPEPPEPTVESVYHRSLDELEAFHKGYRVRWENGKPAVRNRRKGEWGLDYFPDRLDAPLQWKWDEEDYGPFLILDPIPTPTVYERIREVYGKDFKDLKPPRGYRFTAEANGEPKFRGTAENECYLGINGMVYCNPGSCPHGPRLVLVSILEPPITPPVPPPLPPKVAEEFEHTGERRLPSQHGDWALAESEKGRILDDAWEGGPSYANLCSPRWILRRKTKPQPKRYTVTLEETGEVRCTKGKEWFLNDQDGTFWHEVRPAFGYFRILRVVDSRPVEGEAKS